MVNAPFLAVLISAILFKNSHQHSLSLADVPEERVSPPACSSATSGTSACYNCEASQFCFLSNGLPTLFYTGCAGSKPVCGFDTSSSPPQYACVASNSACQCPGTPVLSYKPDPFNSHYYTTCSGTDRISINCGASYYNPQSHDCSATAPPPPLCPTIGTLEDGDPTTCDGYVVCSSSLVVVSSGKCLPPTNYFDPTTRTCVTPIPTFRCQPGYIGYYGDPFDCQRYYVCSGNTLIASGCCQEMENWDNVAETCLKTAACNELPPCASDGAAT